MRRYIKPEKNPIQTAMIIAVAAVMMIMLDLAHTEFQKQKAVEQAQEIVHIEHSEIQDYKSAQEIASYMKPRGSLTDQIFLHVPQPDPVENNIPEAALEPDPQPVIPKEPPKQAWKDNAVRVDVPKEKTKVVIIIDDVGMDRKHSNEVVDMDAPLTLAFLPYAPSLEEITSRARKNGHELLIHMPMEPLNPDLNPGSIALRSGMNALEISQELDKAFASFEGYIGINNHMGSKVTQDEPILHHVMNALAERGLIFVDSKTIANSMAGTIAAEHGLNYAERDVFLDHEDNITFVRGALKKLEAVSRANGSAIAIGHPKASTIQGLREWLPTLEQKGIVLVPVSAVVRNGFLEQGEKAVEVNVALEPEAGDSADAQTEIEPAAGQTGGQDKSLKIEPFPNGLSLESLNPSPLETGGWGNPGASFSAPDQSHSQPPE